MRNFKYFVEGDLIVRLICLGRGMGGWDMVKGQEMEIYIIVLFSRFKNVDAKSSGIILFCSEFITFQPGFFSEVHLILMLFFFKNTPFLLRQQLQERHAYIEVVSNAPSIPLSVLLFTAYNYCIPFAIHDIVKL